MKQIILVLLAGMFLTSCGGNSGKKSESKPVNIATPLPLIYANGDVRDYLDPARAEEVVAIESAGLAVSVEAVHSAGGYYVDRYMRQLKDKSIAGQAKTVPTVKQLQALYLEKKEFNETIRILQNNGKSDAALWTDDSYWTSEIEPEKGFVCVSMESGKATARVAETLMYLRVVAELP